MRLVPHDLCFILTLPYSQSSMGFLKGMVLSFYPFLLLCYRFQLGAGVWTVNITEVPLVVFHVCSIQRFHWCWAEVLRYVWQTTVSVSRLVSFIFNFILGAFFLLMFIFIFIYLVGVFFILRFIFFLFFCVICFFASSFFSSLTLVGVRVLKALQ